MDRKKIEKTLRDSGVTPAPGEVEQIFQILGATIGHGFKIKERRMVNDLLDWLNDERKLSTDEITSAISSIINIVSEKLGKGMASHAQHPVTGNVVVFSVGCPHHIDKVLIEIRKANADAMAHVEKAKIVNESFKITIDDG